MSAFHPLRTFAEGMMIAPLTGGGVHVNLKIWLSGLAVLLCPQVAGAQDMPADREANDLSAELISFRTSEGHGQVPNMAAAIIKRLADAGVPARISLNYRKAKQSR